MIDLFTQYEASRSQVWAALQTPIIFAILFIIFIEINSRTIGFSMAKALPRMQAGIRMHMFDHIQRHSPHYFNERFAGNLANKITDMKTAIETILLQLWWPLLPAIALSIFGALFLGFVSPLLAVILIVWIVVHTAVSLFFSKRCDIYEHHHAVARSTLMGKIVDSFMNNYAVNLFFRFKQERDYLEPVQNKERLVQFKFFINFIHC